MALRWISLVLNLLIAGIVFTTWLRMVLRFDEKGMLTASGLRSLKYFTVLSNLMQGIASLAFALCLIQSGTAPFGVRLLKYSATVCVSLTFLTVVLFLGPLYGYGKMFSGVNLWFHLVVPLSAALDFCLLDRSGAIPFRATFLALIPVLLYAVGYIANLLINGIGEGKSTNDWYSFARGGLRGSMVSFVAVFVGAWIIALLLRLPRRG